MENKTLRRLAPFGLYLALLAALASAGLYIVRRAWDLPLQISLALVVVGLALYGILNPEGVRKALTGRQARYGSNALVLTLAFFGIVVVVNYLIYKNPTRWDLTEGDTRTLTQESLDTLNALPQPVQAIAFYPTGVSTDEAYRALEDFKYYSKGKFDYEFIDPLQDPTAAQQANVTLSQSGTIVFKMADRQETVTFPEESEITGALVRLMSEKQTVYFLTGHNEYSPEDSGDESLFQVRQTLESKSYTVKVLNLLAESRVPEDASLVVIAGPRKPLTADEVEKLKTFANAGGALIVMEEPVPFTEYGQEPDPLAGYLASDWQVQVGNNVIVDPEQSDISLIYGYDYGQHAIIDKLRYAPTFWTVRSVTALEGGAGKELVLTGPNSWSETDLAAVSNNQPIQFDEAADQPGPVSVAVAVDNQQTGARLVVFGDSDFAIDFFVNRFGNGDLIVNSIDWATEQESLLNLTPRESVQRIMLQPTQYTMNLILLGSVFIIPGIVLVAGIVVWIQRRRRG